MDANMKRDILRRTVLELLSNGNMHYTELEKKVSTSCYQFATTNTFKSQLHYLKSNGYVTRISRGIYNITAKGKKYLHLLTE